MPAAALTPRPRPGGDRLRAGEREPRRSRAERKPRRARVERLCDRRTLLVSKLERALDHLERASTPAGRVANEFITGVAGLSAASLVARHADLEMAARIFVNVTDRFERAGDWRQQ
jgi:hypothetical protein